MINLTRIDARGRNGKGEHMFDYLLATEKLSLDAAVTYYAGSGPDPTDTLRWGGTLAAALDLDGQPVTKDAMTKLGQGYSPAGEALCRNAGAEPRLVVKRDRHGNARLDAEGKPMEAWEGGHRVGFDLTISAPGDVSVAFALADDAERLAILGAHRKACAQAMGYLESKVETRRGAQGRDVIAVDGLVWTSADHVSNRNLEPDLHTHHLVYGVARGEDGQWGTFDAMELYQHKRAADALYKAELYEQLRGLGYGIDRERGRDLDGNETGVVEARLAGVPRELVEKTKTRRREILDYLDQHPGASHQDACMATRRKKEEPPYAELTRDWQETLANLAKESPRLVRPTAELKRLRGNAHEVAIPEASAVFERLHETEAVFRHQDLVQEVGMGMVGRGGAADVLAAVEAMTQGPGLVRVQAERLHADDQGRTLARRHRDDRFAADWMLDWENEVVRRAKAREQDHHLKVDQSVVDRETAAFEREKGFTLSAEQRETVRHLTVGTGGVGVVSGLAGTGKTTVAAVYKQAFEAAGRQLFGVAVSNKAAMKLEQESGMPCMSVAKLLKQLGQGKMAFREHDVVVLDEAGMVATGDTLKLMHYCQQQGAKLILQGDSDQLQPIAAGSGFDLAKRAVGDRKLTEIRRQARVEDRAIAQSFYQRDDEGRVRDVRRGDRSRAESLDMGAKIVAALDARGCIDDFGHADHARKAMVDDYLASATPMDEKILLAHSRAEVAAVNANVRVGLKQRGLLDADDATFRSRAGNAWTDLSLARRDRVMFTATNADLGVVNGTEGVVERIREGRKGGYDVEIRVESPLPKENGRLLRFNTSDYNALAHRYAMTVHKAQGQGKGEVYHLATNLGMLDQQSALVAFTRLTHGHYRMYATDEVRERLAERLGTERHKETILDAGVSQSPMLEAVELALRGRLASDARAATDQERSIERRLAR